MAIKTDLNAMLLQEVFYIYDQAEARMLEKVAKRVKRGVNTRGWAEQKLDDTRALRVEVQRTMHDASKVAKAKLGDGLISAYRAGRASANKDHALPASIMQEFIPEHMQRLVLEVNNLIDGTSFQILRNVDDIYREVMAETSTGVLAGVDTPLQAAQDALNKFAARGITGFIDRAGRRWELASYVEMATRTTTARAALQGHLDRQTELGNDLIMVSAFSATCPLCAPWGGKVLSISGNDPDYPSLEQAKAAGLFHPNCKHTILAYFEGMDYTPPIVAPNPEKYKAIEQQRYNERQIRKWKRLEAVAMTPETQARAAGKIRYWQGIQREHIAEWNLRRKYVRESIKNRKGVAALARPDRARANI